MFKKYRERYISQGEEELPGSGSEGRAAPALSPRPVAARVTRPNVLGSGRFFWVCLEGLEVHRVRCKRWVNEAKMGFLTHPSSTPQRSS